MHSFAQLTELAHASGYCFHFLCKCMSTFIHRDPSINFRRLIQFRVAGGLEPIPAVTGRVVYVVTVHKENK